MVRTALHLARRRPLGALGALVLLALALAAMFPEAVATHDPLAQDVPSRILPPSGQHPFGTDSFGRDTFSRVVYGARASLYVGFASVALGAALGILAGIVSAYAGGKADLILQRLVDVLMAFPPLVLALVLLTGLGPSQHTVVVALAAGITPLMARLARSQALVVKEEAYVLAASSLGARPRRILLRHILPNVVPPLVVQATGYLEQAVVAEAALGFLGMGVPPPAPTWGRMLHEGAFGFLEAAPWMALAPGLALTVSVASFALLGDLLRDALDPRLGLARRRRR